jgi:HEAT repeat protein
MNSMCLNKWLGLALAIVSGIAWGQAGELYDAVVTEKTSITNPAKAIKSAEGQWLAFSLPALEGTHSPCCWKGRWSGIKEVGCSLETSHQNFGTRSDSPLTDNVIVYSEIRDGRVHSIQVVGEQCPVNGNGAQVTWIGAVDDKAGLDWLENAARSDSAGSALYAFALHRSPEAGKRLYSLAKETGGEFSQEAIFWLGEARGKEGFKLLKQLLAELPMGERRREIVFALSQNNTPGAAELLFEISKTDPDPGQRGQAMFWLAQEYPHRAQPWLLEVIKTEQDEDVLDQAVFAISQLPGDSGGKMLLDIARDSQTPRHVRRQAIFWMAQSDDDKTVAALTELLTR